ncbi:winged helix-turn-helix domain-containing protein [Sinosporangium siamense]|uniref:GntR family transcriptional regulator n=1 Tax=Sinosporangium siamense TaxID=1367973 RepID=A0A919RJJ2_9ACTN|nr:winged helix-turn-helix domain-containing protein [Sinosporangium siamense]GII95002.1 GntR family transcriptional regulator [Sinosporangium siamense]
MSEEREERRSTPIYQQIAAQVRADIAEGRLVPGQLVPSEAELVRLYGVSRATVRWAVAQLRQEGVVYTIRAEGTYVGPAEVPRIRLPQKREEIARHLVERITGGEFMEGDRFPSETQLSIDYQAARNTIRAAVELLRREGWVSTWPVKGTFVNDRDCWPDEPG